MCVQGPQGLFGICNLHEGTNQIAAWTAISSSTRTELADRSIFISVYFYFLCMRHLSMSKWQVYIITITLCTFKSVLKQEAQRGHQVNPSIPEEISFLKELPTLE